MLVLGVDYPGSASTSVQLYETDEDEEPSGVSRTRFNHTPGRVEQGRNSPIRNAPNSRKS